MPSRSSDSAMLSRSWGRPGVSEYLAHSPAAIFCCTNALMTSGVSKLGTPWASETTPDTRLAASSMALIGDSLALRVERDPVPFPRASIIVQSGGTVSTRFRLCNARRGWGISERHHQRRETEIWMHACFPNRRCATWVGGRSTASPPPSRRATRNRPPGWPSACTTNFSACTTCTATGSRPRSARSAAVSGTKCWTRS